MQAYIESWKARREGCCDLFVTTRRAPSRFLPPPGDKKDTAQQGQIAAAKAAETAPGLAEQRELFIRAHRRQTAERALLDHP